MKTPVFLVGAALLFWGWQCDLLAVALPLAMLVEAGRLLNRRRAPRWTLDDAGLASVADISSLMLIAHAAYLWLTLESPIAAKLVITLAQGLPVTMAPLLLAQAWATRGPMDLSVLFVTLRQRPATGVRADFGFIYLGACLIGASAANVRDTNYYGAVGAFTAWALWDRRSRRSSSLAPFGVLIAASILGFAAHQGLNQLQSAVNDWASEWFDSSASQTNPYRAATDLGTLGELKQNARVLLRVRLATDEAVPLLLHRASYTTFSSPTWAAPRMRFDALTGDATQGWSLVTTPGSSPGVTPGATPGATPGTNPAESPARALAPVEVLEYTGNGRAILSLPAHSARIAGLPPAELKLSSLGSVAVETAPGYLRYRALRDGGPIRESAPNAADVLIPARERQALATVEEQLGLRGLSPAQAMERIARHFAAEFRYATWLSAAPRFAAGGSQTPLARFLLATRAGHCEFFATATVLLARAAGIPARYATGFSVQEVSGDPGPGEREYLVRERHAHAWARVWIDGAWRDVDNTPPQWITAETPAPSLGQRLADAWSALAFAWGRWQTGETDNTRLRLALILAAVAGIAWLAWRLRRSARRSDADGETTQTTVQGTAAAGSLDAIEALLRARGLGRHEAETPLEWVARLGQAGQDGGLGSDALAQLRALVLAHYRLRFDPSAGATRDGTARDEAAALARDAAAWATRWISAAGATHRQAGPA